MKPANPLPHFHRGVALIELAIREDNPQREADFGDAEHELNRAWELSDQRMNEVRLQRARVYERRGNKEAAAHELEAYLKSEPEARNAATVREALAKLRSKKSDK